jgi:hypothetical protein
MPRNRVIYQSEALFVGTGNIATNANHSATDIAQLHRVQSANYGFSVSRQNINQFGNLARIDSIIMEAPTVNLDFTYYLHDGTNERLLGFGSGATLSAAPSFISGLIDTSNVGTLSGRNFHIFTAPEGVDANGLTTGSSNMTGATASTISIGNGFVTNYSVEASVGGIPTVSIAVEGLNINVCEGSTGLNPALAIETSLTGTNTFILPAPVTGNVQVGALRPGDITLTLEEGILTDLPTGIDNASNPALAIETSLTGTNTFILPAPVTGNVQVGALRPGDITLTLEEGILTDLPTGIDNASNTAAHIQSFSIEVPIGRSTLQRLGSNFGYAKVIDFPVEVTVNVTATVADLKAAGDLSSIITSDSDKTLTFQFKDATGGSKIVYQVKGCKIVSENFSSSIGDNKSVDLVFTTQIGGIGDTTNGVFVAVSP